LLDWVVPESELDATVAHLTEQLLKGARMAQGLSKRLVTASFHTSFAEIREIYLEYQVRALAAPEHRAAMDAYLQMQAQRHQEQQPLNPNSRAVSICPDSHAVSSMCRLST
jgi:hypothetical protein